MPAISRFFGVVITMNYNDHSPPHFHVRYGNRKALVAIDTLGLIRGHLPPRVLGFVVEWASQHRTSVGRELGLGQAPAAITTDSTPGVSMLPLEYVC